MIINRYITKEVTYVMLAVLSVLVLIFLCTEFSRYLQQAAEGNIPPNVVMRLFGIAIPALVSLLLPLAYFLGLLLGYGRLYVDNEMTVMNACGMSRKQLLIVTMKQAVVLALVVAILDFWLVPYLARYKAELLKKGASESVLQAILPGKFESSGKDQRVFYIKNIAPGRDSLNDVFIAQTTTVNKVKKPLGKNHSWDIIYAPTAYQSTGEDSKDKFFTAANGYRYLGTPGQPNYMIIKFGTYSVHMPGATNTSPNVKAQAIPTMTLLENYGNKIDAAEFQWRASLPISVLLMALLAVPLSRVRPRQGRFVKLLPAILIYIVYANMLYVARSWVSAGVVPVGIGMWWIHLVLLAVAGFFYLDDYTWRRLFKRA